MKLGDAPLLPPGAQLAMVTQWHGSTGGGHADERADLLADEVPVALVVNGIAHAVMLASPLDLEDFALGFALTEGLIDTPAQLYGVDCVAVKGGIELQLQVASGCAWRLRERRRSLAGRTGCGLCGTDSLGQVRRALPAVVAPRVGLAAVAQAMADLRGHQALQQGTGATHAAGWCALDGRVLRVREDIGRHNALDKLIGAMHRAGDPPGQGFAVISSRASFEMVQKAAAAGIGVLAAVSAPTALAVRVARELGVALAGFVRGRDAVLYTGVDRFGVHDEH